MKSAVITFPGSNCDRDAVIALQKFSSKVQRIWHNETSLDNDLDLIVIPGGFSFGDYLRSGAMASISPIMQEVKRLSQKGVRVLGICNGFQILTESNLLPGVLMRNKKIKFICREVNLRVENNDSDFTKKYKNRQIIKIPIAHMDGNYFAEPNTSKNIEDNGFEQQLIGSKLQVIDSRSQESNVDQQIQAAGQTEDPEHSPYMRHTMHTGPQHQNQ